MKTLKVNIVNYEESFKNNGILTKFANALERELRDLCDIKISQAPDPTADVNHHINYLPYEHELSPDTINTLMITHIWEGYKLEALRKGLETADAGICMSNDTFEDLLNKKIPYEKLAYILPAHDIEKRRPIVFAILTNVYPDGCKREGMLLELMNYLIEYKIQDKFAFRIMGKDWKPLLEKAVNAGFQNIEYFPVFDKQMSKAILDSADYYLYFGKDEGSMATLDAIQAGLKIIAPNIGFHKDVGVEYPFDTEEELHVIIDKLAENRVENLTWKRYAKNHLSAWQKIYDSKK